MNGYVIVDANKTTWVCQDTSGSYSLTTDKNKAMIFESKLAADKVFKSNLSKLIKSKGVVVKSVALQIAGANNTPKQASVGANNENKHETVAVIDAPFGSTEYIVSVLSDTVNKLNSRHTVLVSELSKYDRQCADVEHYIEFNAGKLNACDGYKAYKLLQDVLVNRRKIKDELKIINVARDRITDPDTLASIDNEVQKVKTQRYLPREFAYLFGEQEGD